MTADRTGVRNPLLPRETRRLTSYGRTSALSEHELLEGYAIRLDMLRGLGDAPASPYRARRGCPCHDDRSGA